MRYENVDRTSGLLRGTVRNSNLLQSQLKKNSPHLESEV